MFSSIGKKKNKIRIADRVFISSAAKQSAIQAKVLNQPGLIIIAWFDDSFSQIKKLLELNDSAAEIYMAREIAAHHVQGKKILFFEHYPSLVRENELLEKLQLREAVFYSSLDEPLFKHFGGERMIFLVEKMGLSENEAVEHPLISAAIKNAQEKISKEIITEYSAQSQAEWFCNNIVK